MTDAADAPRWPDDLLYVPVNHPDHQKPKGPDAETWGADGSGCTPHADLHDRRWGIVDVDRDGWRLLTLDLDHYKAELPDEDLTPEQAAEIIQGLDAAPETRTHESSSGGTHVFYWIPEDELEYEEHKERYVLPFSLAEGIDDRLNGYVLSPHCEGYTVENDRQPAVLGSLDELPEEWKQDEDDSHDGIDWTKHVSAGASRSDIYQVPGLTRSQYPEDERTEHFKHGSSTGANFMVDAGGETARCWRHAVTMDDVHVNAIRRGIISCGDIGNLSSRQRSEMMEAAEEDGLRDKLRPSREERQEHVQSLDTRRTYDTVREATFPSTSFVLDKPPREGGSHWMMEHFVQKPHDLLILTPRHSIVRQHCGTLSDEILADTDMGAVHFEGHNRACDHDGHGQCPDAPQSYPELVALEDEARNVLHRKKIVTADDAPDHTCPAAFLRVAAETASVVVTVPQLFPTIADVRDLTEMNLMIDEEQTLSHFWPPSVNLIDVKMEFDTDGSISIEQRNREIESQIDTLQNILDTIHDEQDDRREDGDGFRRNSHEIAIEEAVETFEEIRDLLSTADIVGELLEDGKRPNLGNTVERMEDNLSDVELPDPNGDPDRIFSNIKDYAAPYFWNDNVAPGQYLTAASFAYDDRPFDFKLTGDHKYTLRLIGDKERDPFLADQFEQFNQIGIIAGPEGERFLDAIHPGSQYIEIEEFRYADHYTVLPVAKETEENGTESVDGQRNRVKRVSKELNERDKPHMAVTGTKDRASALASDYTGGSASVVGNPQSPAKELYSLWAAGATSVIYENSVVSRGIDAPFFDITCLCEPGFATPYWEAKARHHKDEEGGEGEEAISYERELKERELTNAALRTAPTYPLLEADETADRWTNFIVVSKFDAPSLLYLQDRRLDVAEDMAPFESVDEVANILDTLSVDGAAERTYDTVLSEVGGTDKDFIHVAMTENFVEDTMDRPYYEMGEIADWVSEGILTDDALKERVVGKIATANGPPTTREILNATPGPSDGAVRSTLSILERQGVVEKLKGKRDGSEGKPVVRWELG